MGLINDLKYNFNNLNILKKIIVLMIICFIVPKTIIYLFELKPSFFIKLFLNTCSTNNKLTIQILNHSESNTLTI